MTTCGFCSTKHHEQCVSAVRNGSGKLTECGCGCERSRLRRCTECQNREQDQIGTDWYCLDRDACQARINKRLDENPVVQSLRQAQRRAEQRREESGEQRQRRRQQAQPKAQREAKCRCCGEPTKGGNFLPGHDSRYLNQLITRVRDKEITAPEAVATCTAISSPLAVKLDKRITREGL